VKTKRPISINNSLVHGICNCNCLTCGVNKPSYKGPKTYQSGEVTEKIIDRIKEAALEGVHIRYIANSGDGEPTLHPEFAQRMEMFGNLLRYWNAPVPRPEISVVSNGLNLLNEGVLEAVVKNGISLKVSFPTANPEHYGEIMMMNKNVGDKLMVQIQKSLERVMCLTAEGKLTSLDIHISPPYHKYIKADFENTLYFLTTLARDNGLKDLHLMLFPALSNRAGVVRNLFTKVEWYRDFQKTYSRSLLNGVRLHFNSLLNRFFYNYSEATELFSTFNYPCLWYGNIFLTPFGDSCCCNDQNVCEPNGNVLQHSIKTIMEMKETKESTQLCLSCNQRPDKLKELFSKVVD